MKHKIPKMDIIAEIGQAHEGSLGIAHSYIDALKDTGVTAVKFQTHIAQAESSPEEPFRVKFSYEDETRMEYWRRMEFSKDQWQGLKNHCEEARLEFISSPFSNAAVDLLESIGVQRYKIGSGEMTNFLMLEKIARTGKPILLSSGMSSLAELRQTIDFLKAFGNDLRLFQCTTAYPTQPEDWGLNAIQELSNEFGLPVGFSDHSGDIYACLAAASLGASFFEFHVVFDKRMFGPDTPASLTINQVKQLTKGLFQIENALKSPHDKSNNSRYISLKSIFEKSLAVNCDLPAGTIIQFNMLEAKKPFGMGIPSSQFHMVLGRELKSDISAWSFLNQTDLKDE
jgi:N-acetylneuraminate synthase